MKLLSLRKYLEEKGHREATIEKIAPTIEDCFMALQSEE